MSWAACPVPSGGVALINDAIFRSRPCLFRRARSSPRTHAAISDPQHSVRLTVRRRTWAICCTRTRRARSRSTRLRRAHVFYPEATDERCTAALLLDVDPVGLVRGRGGRGRRRPARAVRQRSAVRRVVVSERGDRRCLRQRAGGPEQGAPGARGDTDPADGADRGAPLPRWRGFLRAALRAARLLVSAASTSRSTILPNRGESRYFTVELSATNRA